MNPQGGTHVMERPMLHYIQDSANAEYLRLMADIEHDDPEHAPTYRGETLVCVAGVVLTTPERARELLEDAA